MFRCLVPAAFAVVLVACAGTPQPKRETVYVPPVPDHVAPSAPVAQTAPVPDAPSLAVEPVPEAQVVEAPKPVAPTLVPDAPKKPKPVAPPPVVAKVAPAPKAPVPVVETRPASSPGAEGNALKGHIDLIVGTDQNVGASEVADAVVYFVPSVAGAKPKPGQFQIYTRDKKFDPASLVVPVGSTVSFPNRDEILHNVFSASVGEEFDLGVYGEGASASHTFKKPGLFIINCNVHQAMQSSVLVVDTPFYTHPSKNGDFVLDGVPAGSGKFVIWHPRAASVERVISVPSADATWSITVTKPRVSGHLNRERKTYKLDITQN
jgi:plastocyanin